MLRRTGYAFYRQIHSSGMNGSMVLIVAAAEIGRYWGLLLLRGVARGLVGAPGASPVGRTPSTRLGVL